MGKTHWSKRNKRVVDPKTTQYIEGDLVLVTFGHTLYTKYDAALVISDDQIKANIESRKKQRGKKWSKLKDVLDYKQRVIEYANKNKLKLYTSFEQCVNTTRNIGRT